MRRARPPGAKPTDVPVSAAFAVGEDLSCGNLDERQLKHAAAITRDPEVMHGTPVFCGTRVSVKTPFDYLESGEPLDEFLAGFPTVSRDLAIQVLEESKELRLARV